MVLSRISGEILAAPTVFSAWTLACVGGLPRSPCVFRGAGPRTRHDSGRGLRERGVGPRHGQPVAANLLKRDFSPQQPNGS